MNFDHQAQKKQNQEAMLDPQPGDYWHEMLCPYFMVVQVRGDRITILNCLESQGPSSVKTVDAGHWTFDVCTFMVVNREWISQRVQYGSTPGFVADVVRGREKHMAFVDEWIQQRGKKLVQELQDLGPEVSRQILMEQW